MGGKQSTPDQTVQSTGQVNNNIIIEDEVKIQNTEIVLILSIICVIKILEFLYMIYKAHKKGLHKRFMASTLQLGPR